MQAWWNDGLSLREHLRFAWLIPFVAHQLWRGVRWGMPAGMNLLMVIALVLAMVVYASQWMQNAYVVASSHGLETVGGRFVARRRYFRWHEVWIRDPDKRIELAPWQRGDETPSIPNYVVRLLYMDVGLRSYRAAVTLPPTPGGEPAQTVTLHALERLPRSERAAAMREIHRRWREAAKEGGPRDMVGA
jgi:hypothetical protein